MSGIYTGTMGMLSNMTKLNVHSNNVSNMNTNGYKKDQGTFRTFEESFMKMKYKGENKNIGGYKDMVYIDDVKTNFKPGAIMSTNDNYDFSLHDEKSKEQTSFFVVSKNEQEYLTRNGNFKVDADRRLTTMNGGLVLNENDQPIVIPDKNGENGSKLKFYVDEEGTIFNFDTKEEIDTMKLATVESSDLGLLEKSRGGFYEVMSYDKIVNNFGSIENIIKEFNNNISLQKKFGSIGRLMEIRDTGNVEVLNEFNGEVKQHTLEASNVNMNEEILGIMEAQRGVQSNQKIITVMDKILGKEANDLAR